MKHAVEIAIESVMDGEKTFHRMQGRWYRKGDHAFVRYEETDPSLGRTATTMKYSADEIRIVRHGEIEAEQTYIPGRRLRGTYRTGQGMLALENLTHLIRTAQSQTEERIFWSYDLYIDDERIGTYELTVTVRPVEQLEAEQ